MLRRHGVSGGRRARHRVPRPRAGATFRDGPPRDRQHGRRTRRDHNCLPGRRAGARSSCARAGPRGRLHASSSPTRTPTYDLTEEIDLSTLRAADRPPGIAGQCGAGARGRRRARVPGRGRLLGQPRPSRLRHRRRDRRGPPGAPAGLFDVNPTSRQMLADLTAMGATLELIRAGARHPPGRMPRLHRDGPGPGHRTQQPAHLSPQLPRPFRHRGRPGMAVLAGNRRGLRADRGHHRPAGLAGHGWDRASAAGLPQRHRRTAPCWRHHRPAAGGATGRAGEGSRASPGCPTSIPCRTPWTGRSC